ncbi:MAG: alginate lyase family protein [Hydrogenophaga sp.]|uniref:heparinase II/III family protein n=1 Tax=Hydrogenophaga sp. TaxID=1904254 RepID=UPI00262F4744|nr:alginate lyase family protein [Hydrogenophaga sp.]MDM7943746.1 alginate lyase family protein [Hydrogenophaga sp.]
MSPLQQVHRYWETLRHLRPPQIWGRVAHRLHTPHPPQFAPAPPRAQPGVWTFPARRIQSVFGAERFTFLNVQGDLAIDGWDGTEKEKLWRYNQHYFDDLNAHGWASRAAWHESLITDWIRRNPPAEGTGWESYPTSLRIVNWIKWSLASGKADPAFLDSLATQARWLANRLETHLLGNHLFVNAKALLFAGSYFTGTEANTWRRVGSQLLEREIPEQILPDGGQFERSPMYHALAFEDMLDLHNLARCFADCREDGVHIGIPGGKERLQAMWRWLLIMSHPDGGLSLFNDAAADIAPSVQELDTYARRLGLEPPSDTGTAHLQDSGYVRLQSDRAVVLFDAAPVGPDYLPAHAHADTLSLELSYAGSRVLVNSGTSLYAEGLERSRQRGTKAHNTVVINEQDSSEVWGSFRVARRAFPHDVSISLREDTQQVSASHDGYVRLRGNPVHRRSVTLTDHGCRIADHIEGSFQRAQSRFHFHPSAKVSVEPCGSQGECHLPDGQVLTWRVDGGRAHAEPSTWHPAFGITVPNQCIELEWSGDHSCFELRWGGSTDRKIP